MGRTLSNDNSNLIKNRVLTFIVNNPFMYGVKELANLFQVSERTIQNHVKDLNSLGYKINSVKGKYINRAMPCYNTFNETLCTVGELKLLALYMFICDSCASNGKVSKDILLHNVLINEFAYIENEDTLNNMIYALKAQGYIEIEDGFILDNNLISFKEDELQQILVELMVKKHYHFDKIKFEFIYNKLKVLSNLSNVKFSDKIIRYETFKRMSTLDELILQMINKAIENNNMIKITYLNKGRKQYFNFVPRATYYNNIKDFWYVIGSNTFESNYRLDKIIGIELLNIADNPLEVDLRPYEKALGVSIEKPTYVKVRFDNKSFMIRKLYEYKLERQNCKLYFRGDYFYLEDEVLSLNEFERFIRGFGIGCVVLEPEKLISNFKDNLLLWKVRYDENLE